MLVRTSLAAGLLALMQMQASEALAASTSVAEPVTVAVREGHETPTYGATSFALMRDGTAYVLDPIRRAVVWLQNNKVQRSYPINAPGMLRSIANIEEHVVLSSTDMSIVSPHLVLGRHSPGGLLTSSADIDPTIRTRALAHFRAEAGGHIGRAAVLPRPNSDKPAGNEISIDTPDVDLVSSSDVRLNGDPRYRYAFAADSRRTGVIWLNDKLALPIAVPHQIGAVDLVGILAAGDMIALVEDVRVAADGQLDVTLYRYRFDSTGTPHEIGTHAVQPKTAANSYREILADSSGRLKSIVLASSKGASRPGQGSVRVIDLPFKATSRISMQELAHISAVAGTERTSAKPWEMPNGPAGLRRSAAIQEADALLNVKWRLQEWHLQPPLIGNERTSADCDSCKPRKVTIKGRVFSSYAHCWELPYFLHDKKPEVEVCGVPYGWGSKLKDSQKKSPHEILGERLTNGTYTAGHTCAKRGDFKKGVLGSGAISTVAGLDCSGFVGAAWRSSIGMGTGWIHGNALAIKSLSALQPADVINRNDSHVVLFKAWATTPKGIRVRAYESSLFCSGVCLRDFRFRELAGYQLRNLERAL